MLRHPLGKKTKYINQFWPKFILDKQGVNGTNSKFSDPRNLRSYVTIKFKNMFKILFKWILGGASNFVDPFINEA